MRNKILEIVKWRENPDWSDKLTKYTMSLSAASIASHLEATNTELSKSDNPKNMLYVMRGCFIDALKHKLNF